MNSFELNPIFKERWGDGFKTGILGGSFQSPTSAQNPLDQFSSLYKNPDFTKLPESVQNTIITSGLIGGLNKPQYSIEELEGLREREARRAQELGKESLRETMKAKMFYDLPGNVAKAFSGPASVYYAGMSQVPGVYNQAVSAFRPLSINSTSVVSPGSVPSYFS